MPIQVTCPQPQMNVLIKGQGPNSPGFICVCGTSQDSQAGQPKGCLLSLFRAMASALERLFGSRPGKPLPEDGSLFIRTRVVSGWAGTTGLSPSHQTGDSDTSPNPKWCTAGPQVPNGTASGAKLTAIAWLLSGSDTTTLTVVDGPHLVYFYAGGDNPTDCCASCSGSSSGSSSASSPLAALGARPLLEVTVPDGPSAGRHRALAVAFLTWQFAAGGQTYTVRGLGESSLLAAGPAASAPPRALEWRPFSAVFPGAVFGSAGEVVVTVA